MLFLSSVKTIRLVTLIVESRLPVRENMVTSHYSKFKKLKFLGPFSKGAEKTQSYFDLDNEQ